MANVERDTREATMRKMARDWVYARYGVNEAPEKAKPALKGPETALFDEVQARKQWIYDRFGVEE